MKEIEKKVRDNFNLAFEKSLGEMEEQDDDTLEDIEEQENIYGLYDC